MRHRPIIAIVLALAAALPALGQAQPPGEVRAYLSTYTDDGSSARATTPSTSTWTWNMTEVRKRWVCPYCGYSTYWEDATPGDDECPNPFGIAAHPANVLLVQADAKTRVLGFLAATSCDDDGDEDLPLVGRPFHPGGLIEPIWNDDPSPWETPTLENVASYLTARAAIPAGAGELVENGDGVRFLVVKPGSVRAAAGKLYFDSSDTIVTAPAFLMTAGGGGATADQYVIHINPYRVSDGDVWYIRHHEERAGGVTTVVAVQAYSTLYGNDFDTQGGIAGAGLTNYDTNGGCQIITDSGALRVEIPEQLAADGAGTWVLKIVINSNTRTMPSPDEVNYDSVYGVDMYTDPGEDEPDFLTNGIIEDLSPTKAPYVVVDDTRTPLIASADAGDGTNYLVEEKLQNGDGFVHTATAHADEIWPYRMPPEAAGVGRIITQWSELSPSAALQSATVGGADIFYRIGGEWQYLADLGTRDNRIMTNADVAANTALTGNLDEDYSFLDARFMCGRLDVNLTGDEWVHGTMPAVPTETDDEPATGGFPGILIGDLIAAGPPDQYGGEYGPGTHTPTRDFTIANRAPAPVSVCPVSSGGCGARYLRSDYAPGDACPACGIALVAGHGEADACYDAHTAPAALVAGNRYWMTPEALRFGPGANPVPMGALDFVQQVFADIPAYQPPSVPPDAGSPYANDIDNDGGYYGTMVAFDRPGGTAPTDANFAWDTYFRSPNTGNRFGSPAETGAAAEAENVCPVCQARYSSAVAPTDCLYCGATLSPETPPVPESALVAEEFDPFGLQVSVLRRAALAANQRIVDLGWVAPGVPITAPNVTNDSTEMVAGSTPEPADVSARSDVPVRNEGNITSVAEMRSGYLFRTEIDPAVRSLARWAQSVPMTVGTLFRYRPGGPLPTDDIEFSATAWALARQEATGAVGEEATARVQAGHRDDGGAAYAGVTKPVPLGQPVGNYASEVILFIDLDGNGALNFYDALVGVTDSGVTEFDPDVDEPFEPVASFATRMRVVEGRLPQNDFYSRDVDPTVLVDTGRDNLQVIWAGQRAPGGSAGAPAPAGIAGADAAAPSDPMNLLYANGELSLFGPDPLYRGYLWTPPGGDPAEADALTTSATADESNSSPTAYIDPTTGDRWAMWHRSLTTAAGMSSQLRFDSSGGVDWDGSSAT